MSTLKIESKEKEIVEVDKRIVELSVLLQNMLEDDQNLEETIPLHQYSTDLIKLVVAYCEIVGYKNEGFIQKPILNLNLDFIFSNPQEKAFFQGLSIAQLHDLLLIANFMNIPKLVDACCGYIAYIFKTKLDDELKDIYRGVDCSKITDDEEKELREEYKQVLSMDKNKYLNTKAAEHQKQDEQRQ